MSLSNPKIKTNTWSQNYRRRKAKETFDHGKSVPGIRTEAHIAKKARSKAHRAQRSNIEELKRQQRETVQARKQNDI